MIREVRVSHRPTLAGPTFFTVMYEVAGIGGEMTIPAQGAIDAKQIASARLGIPFRMYA